MATQGKPSKKPPSNPTDPRKLFYSERNSNSWMRRRFISYGLQKKETVFSYARRNLLQERISIPYRTALTMAMKSWLVPSWKLHGRRRIPFTISWLTSRLPVGLNYQLLQPTELPIMDIEPRTNRKNNAALRAAIEEYEQQTTTATANSQQSSCHSGCCNKGHGHFHK